MTQQEAEALAARLTRIWAPEKVDYRLVCYDPHHHPNAFYYTGHISQGVRLEVDDYDGYLDDSAGHTGDELRVDLHVGGIYLAAETKCGIIEAQYWVSEGLIEYRKATARWMPFFRRGCWLSGLPVEATAHEKAEWVQGFTREELEAWNLRF